jgi:type I restriction enzyme S subunit
MEVKPLRQGSVRAGYKQTEVGVIPEEWDVQTGEQITTLIGKGGSPRWQGFEYSNGGMLFVTSENVRDGFLDIREPKYLPLAFHEKLKRTQLQKHDILVNLVGASIGRSCQIQQDIGEANVNQAVAVFRVKHEHSSEFLACCFQAPTTIERILEMQVDAARPNISLGDLRRFPIQLPPLPEQRAIATALSDVDGLLGGLDRLIAKKRDLKQAAMQQLLTGQTRLPGFHGEWEVKTLGDIVEKIVGGGTPSRANPAFWGNEIPWVTVKDFTTFNPRHSQESITRLGLRNSASHLIPAGTLITSTRMALGKAVVYEVDVAINQDLKALFLKQETSVVFLIYWFEYFGSLIDELGSGSTVKGISLVELRRFPFRAPVLAEQTAIAEVLTDMDAELAGLEQRREKTRALKQAMMQELLTGKTRLIN